MPATATRKVKVGRTNPTHQEALIMARTRTPDTHVRTAQAAEILQVHPRTVTRWAREGRLPYMRTLGGHRVYPEAAIRELLKELTQEVWA